MILVDANLLVYAHVSFPMLIWLLWRSNIGWNYVPRMVTSLVFRDSVGRTP